MDIEELTWKALRREVGIDSLGEYTLYYMYSILMDLKRRLISAQEKYPEELQALEPIIELVNELIEDIYQRVKNMDICYAVLEASINIAKTVSKRVFEKLLKRSTILPCYF